MLGYNLRYFLPRRLGLSTKIFIFIFFIFIFFIYHILHTSIQTPSQQLQSELKAIENTTLLNEPAIKLLQNNVECNYVRNGGIVVDNILRKQHLKLFYNLKQNQTEYAFPIFPDETQDLFEDRILNQMEYIPKQLSYIHDCKLNAFSPSPTVKDKLILFYNGMGVEKRGKDNLLNRNCPVTQCDITDDKSRFSDADLVLWQYHFTSPFKSRNSKQTWGLMFLESPFHSFGFKTVPNLNFSMTYLRNSTIVTPYYKFTPFDRSKDRLSVENFKMPIKDYAKGKTKAVAWFVSNCGSTNQRINYAHELSKHIQVDIYGGCGKLSCGRHESHNCFSKLKLEYKFYLAFENSNCRDYITEKLFLNALSNEVVPIVMGAHPDDYLRTAPFHSFIHVNHFESPQKLAEYLHFLDKNNDAYNTYFAWVGSGLLDTDTNFVCRLCMLAHEVDNVEPGRFMIDPEKADNWWKKSCLADNSGSWVTSFNNSIHEKNVMELLAKLSKK